MENNSNINELSIGEIEIADNGSYARIYCHLPVPTEVSAIVQDEMGRSRVEEKCFLNEGHQEFDIDISKLGSGHYHAWIDLMGKTFIRNFQITEKASNAGWIDSVKNFFS